MWPTPTDPDGHRFWFEEHYSQTVDARLKANIEASRFDDRIDRAIADHKAGRTEPL
ncbi:MAG TPA: hypothetical protein VIY49_30770 [Bryobacteraceae bacterium]